MPEPLVSVIMPAYNAGKFIAESITSVVDQTYKNWELLIADDGSTDDTKLIVQRFCAADVRIKYYYQRNGKQGKARNLALAHATGKFVAFLDADDIWLPRKLEIQLQQIEDKKADLVFSDAYMFTGAADSATKKMNAGTGYYAGDTALREFLEKNKIPVLTVLMKTEVLEDAGGFSENILLQDAEDYHLWLRLLINNKKFYGSGLVLAAYREHVSSSTNADNLAIAKVVEALEDLKRTYPRYKKMIHFYLRRWFEKYQLIGYKENYRAVIKKNCNYMGKPAYNFMFQVLYLLFGFNITKNLMNRTLNKTLALH